VVGAPRLKLNAFKRKMLRSKPLTFRVNKGPTAHLPEVARTSLKREVRGALTPKLPRLKL
jgi:hypothetical protein